jgi:periplasmic protein TonB
MTPTVKNPPEMTSTGKPGASNQNSENKSGQSPRSNPVCLEVIVTIRSLPNEAGGPAKPIREESRTVIVFDNGAVLRNSNNLPVGQTVILSNPNGRDVVCRVVGARNMPSLKGYVEVEFIEPVNDFWGIHQIPQPAVHVAPPPAVPLPARESSAPQTPSISRNVSSTPTPAKPASVSLGSGPSFDDIPGLKTAPPPAAAREMKAEPASSSLGMMNKGSSNYSHVAVAEPTSVAGWHPSEEESAKEKGPIPTVRDVSVEIPSVLGSTPAPKRDFMSKGLMAYEQGGASNASTGKAPLIVGVAALALAGVCGIVYMVHQPSAPPPTMDMGALTRPINPIAPTARSTSVPMTPLEQEASQAAAQSQAQTQPLPQNVAAEPAPSAAALAPVPVPAVVTNPVTEDSRLDSRNSKRQEKKSVAPRQPDPPPTRQPAIANLKMNTPSAPIRSQGDSGDAASPASEIAAAVPPGATPPAGLLTAAGRTSNPPAPPAAAFVPANAPAPAPAPKTLRDPKLISSTRPVYPPSARQLNVQGSVTISATIDENGKVVSARALNGPLLLRDPAVDSVKQWKYSPGLADGKPVPSQVTVNVDFRLN